MLDELLARYGWSTDGYGDFDSNVIHDECGTMVEPDCPACPECGDANPLVKLGMI